MKMEKIPLARPEMTDEMISAATQALKNERLVLGESVFKFEEAFARYTGVKHAISVSSGTDALQLAFIALGIEGKDVVTSPLSFIATANSVLQANGTPKFADSSLSDNNLDPALIKGAMTDRTAALLPVHLFGHPCRMSELIEIAQDKDVKVVEDACQAHGAVFDGKKAGSIGDVGCFSFYPTKNMTVGGDGGMVTTNDTDLAKLIAKLRDCGRLSRYVHDVVGYTSRLNSANAAIGLVQLKYLDRWNERRRAIAGKYNELLKDIPEVGLPPREGKGIVPVFHLYAIHCQRRDELEKALISAGVECGVHYPVPIHMQPIYRKMYGFNGGEFPVSERLSQQLLSLPIFPSMRDDQIKRVADEVAQFYHRRA
jgi:perosamine synthetase